MNLVPNQNFNFIRFPQSVDDEKSFGQVLRQMEVAFAYFSVKLDILLFHSVGHVRNAVLDPLKAYFGRDVQNNGEVGNDASHGKGIDLGNRIVSNLPGNPLVNSRRVQEAVAKNDLAVFHSRHDDLTNQLSPACGKEKEFCFGKNVFRGIGMHEEVTDVFAYYSSSGLPRDDHIPVVYVLQSICQSSDLR